MRVLLAEDDVNFARLLTGELADPAILLDCVDNGIDAVSRALLRPYDAVLLDLRLPRMDGLNVLRIIRILRPNLPVIAYSGKAGAEEIQDALAAGALQCLAKPFSIEELKRILEENRVGPPAGG